MKVKRFTVLALWFCASAGFDQAVLAQELKNTIKWATASENYNFGYDIYRAEDKNGPFQRISPKPIMGSGTTDVPTYYEYIDDTIEPDRRYYYYVESISFSGKRKKFTPVMGAKPKSSAVKKH